MLKKLLIITISIVLILSLLIFYMKWHFEHFEDISNIQHNRELTEMNNFHDYENDLIYSVVKSIQEKQEVANNYRITKLEIEQRDTAIKNKIQKYFIVKQIYFLATKAVSDNFYKSEHCVLMDGTIHENYTIRLPEKN